MFGDDLREFRNSNDTDTVQDPAVSGTYELDLGAVIAYKTARRASHQGSDDVPMASELVFETAPADWTVRVMTVIAVLVLIAILLGIALFKKEVLPAVPILGLGFLLVGYVWASSPKRYVIQGDTLYVERNLKAALRFPEVRGAMPAQGAVKGLIRVFGNGGLFSYYG